MAVLAIVTRTWLSIRVDLVSGRGEHFWPRPGRNFAAARTHRFGQLAEAINSAFARWDSAHLYHFLLADGTRIGEPEFDDFDEDVIDASATTLSKLSPGEQFAYEFDFGDSWIHLCTVRPERLDVEEELGVFPPEPVPYWGWGTIPDQYGRRWPNDDDEDVQPADPGVSDLPPLIPGWGPS